MRNKFTSAESNEFIELVEDLLTEAAEQINKAEEMIKREFDEELQASWVEWLAKCKVRQSMLRKLTQVEL